QLVWDDATSSVQVSTKDPKLAVKRAADIIRPSVVGIVVRRPAIDDQGWPTYLTFSGSGFVAHQDGYIWTNYHVVEGAAEIKVMTADHQVYSAKVNNYDSLDDLALLKIDATGLPVPTLRKVDSSVIGEQVAAMGSPEGLQFFNTVSAGVISGVGVATDGWVPYIQTDAPINPGNSGGPVFDLDGNVVGIATWKMVGVDVEGFGFLIPSETLDDAYAHFQEDGLIIRPFLGVATIESWEASVGLPSEPGLEISSVTVGSAAEKAGLVPGDRIMAFNARPVSQRNDFTQALAACSPGDTVTMSIQSKDGAVRTVSVLLRNRPWAPAVNEYFRKDAGYYGGFWSSLSADEAAAAADYGKQGYKHRDTFDLSEPFTFANGYAYVTAVTPYLSVALDSYDAEEAGRSMTAADLEAKRSLYANTLFLYVSVLEDSPDALTGTSLKLVQGSTSLYPEASTTPEIAESVYSPKPPAVHWTQAYRFHTWGLDPDRDLTVRITLPGGRVIEIPVEVGRLR
ncbi:MAG: S1C family serine protease, partial [Bacillota bacterium]